MAAQLEAYNARDIDSFIDLWAHDSRYYLFPDELLAVGLDQIRQRHIERFKEPDLHGKLLSRIVVGNMVVDHERVTRNFPEGKGEVEVLCIYEVSDALISKAWFKMGERQLF